MHCSLSEPLWLLFSSPYLSLYLFCLCLSSSLSISLFLSLSLCLSVSQHLFFVVPLGCWRPLPGSVVPRQVWAGKALSTSAPGSSPAQQFPGLTSCLPLALAQLREASRSSSDRPSCKGCWVLCFQNILKIPATLTT